MTNDGAVDACVLEHLTLPPGPHDLVVVYRPLADESATSEPPTSELRLQQTLDVVAGRIHRVRYASEESRLVISR